MFPPLKTLDNWISRGVIGERIWLAGLVWLNLAVTLSGLVTSMLGKVYRPSLPEIEHTTMRIAQTVGIETAENGLLRLKDGNLAYVTKRFDRRENGTKVRQ